MAYKFRIDEPIALGVERIALDQIEHARKQLLRNEDPVEVVQARTRSCTAGSTRVAVKRLSLDQSQISRSWKAACAVTRSRRHAPDDR